MQRLKELIVDAPSFNSESSPLSSKYEDIDSGSDNEMTALSHPSAKRAKINPDDSTASSTASSQSCRAEYMAPFYAKAVAALLNRGTGLGNSSPTKAPKRRLVLKYLRTQVCHNLACRLEKEARVVGVQIDGLHDSPEEDSATTPKPPAQQQQQQQQQQQSQQRQQRLAK